MALKLTPAQQKIDAQLRAVNRKLTSTAAAFGMQSEQYRYLEALIVDIYMEPGQTRKNKAGVTQLARNRKNVLTSALPQEQKVIGKIMRVPSIKEQKQQILESWAKEESARRAGIQYENGDEDITEESPEDIIAELSQRERRDIIEQRIGFYKALQDAIAQSLDMLYDRTRRKSRAQYRSLQRVREISRGHWTTTDELTEMLTTLTDSLGREGQKIMDNYYKKIGVNV